jgi:hypothetical protein
LAEAKGEETKKKETFRMEGVEKLENEEIDRVI